MPKIVGDATALREAKRNFRVWPETQEFDVVLVLLLVLVLELLPRFEAADENDDDEDRIPALSRESAITVIEI